MKALYKFYILFIFFHTIINLQAQNSISSAQSMFIYNFTRFTDWPENAKTGNFIITVIGNSDVISDLESFCVGKKVGLQNIVIKKVKEIEEITSTHILFVSYNKSAKMSEIVSKIAGSYTLLIAEKAGLCANGAAINFVLNEDKLRFELKVANATKYGLKINSKLESMAIIAN